jgi:hypothetical protein
VPRVTHLLLLLAVATAVGCGSKSPQAVEAERRDETKTNLKALGQALQVYEKVYGQLPGSSSTRDGNGLSWRVQILPYLGKDREKVFAQFHLMEPWDSPHNKTLIDQMPAVFALPGKPAETGHTYVRGLAGPRAIFPAKPRSAGNATGVYIDSTRGRSTININDGSSNTLMVAEAAEAVIWIKPDELLYDEISDGNTPLPKFGGAFPDGFHGVMADGSVMFFPNALTDDALLRRAILTNDFTQDTKPEEYLFLNPIRQANGVKLHEPFVPYRASAPPTKPSDK